MVALKPGLHPTWRFTAPDFTSLAGVPGNGQALQRSTTVAGRKWRNRTNAWPLGLWSYRSAHTTLATRDSFNLTSKTSPEKYFAFFNEIGIIEQLSRTVLEAQLPDGIIAPHFTVLNHLVRVKDGQTPLTLARAFQVPKTSMTHTLSVLHKRGLVDLRVNEEDARSKRVWITPDGLALREEAISLLGTEMMSIREVVSPQELELVMPVLVRLREYLDKARD